jgi:hypothetical protein
MTDIFVFGSNLRGVHGAGAAKFAFQYRGAIIGQGVGRQGDSYAIPTKDYNIETLDLPMIKQFVLGFIDYAVAHPELSFTVTRVGCGLAGYSDEDIAPMFKDAPSNCTLDPSWSAFNNGT